MSTSANIRSACRIISRHRPVKYMPQSTINGGKMNGVIHQRGCSKFRLRFYFSVSSGTRTRSSEKAMVLVFWDVERFSLYIAWDKGTSANSDAFVANLRRLNSHIQQAGQRTTAHQPADDERFYKISLDNVPVWSPGMYPSALLRCGPTKTVSSGPHFGPTTRLLQKQTRNSNRLQRKTNYKRRTSYKTLNGTGMVEDYDYV